MRGAGEGVEKGSGEGGRGERGEGRGLSQKPGTTGADVGFECVITAAVPAVGSGGECRVGDIHLQPPVQLTGGQCLEEFKAGCHGLREGGECGARNHAAVPAADARGECSSGEAQPPTPFPHRLLSPPPQPHSPLPPPLHSCSHALCPPSPHASPSPPCHPCPPCSPFFKPLTSLPTPPSPTSPHPPPTLRLSSSLG